MDQAQGIRQMKSQRPVRVIAFTSGKGGVGKSNITVNLAVALAQSGERVMVLDADLGLANIDVLLGLAPSMNLSHVINGECSLEETIIEGPSGIRIIPASSGVAAMSDLTPAQNAGIIRSFSDLTEPVDTLLIDTAAGIADSVVSFSRAARESPRRSSLLQSQQSGRTPRLWRPFQSRSGEVTLRVPSPAEPCRRIQRPPNQQAHQKRQATGFL